MFDLAISCLTNTLGWSGSMSVASDLVLHVMCMLDSFIAFRYCYIPYTLLLVDAKAMDI